jgi:hypothetical protein
MRSCLSNVTAPADRHANRLSVQAGRDFLDDLFGKLFTGYLTVLDGLCLCACIVGRVGHLSVLGDAGDAPDFAEYCLVTD